MADRIDKDDDVIFGRDLRERLSELELDEEIEKDNPGSDDHMMFEDEREELAFLRRILEEAPGADVDGAYFVNDAHFAAWATEEWESDTGEAASDWPYRHIDWDEAADELRTDYTTFVFDGVTFYTRSSH